MKKIISFLLASVVFVTEASAQDALSLAGEWTFRLDSLNIGVGEQWYQQSFQQTIQLPGTLDDAAIGVAPTLTDEKLTRDVLLSLTRKHRYIGVAWYQKEIMVPAGFSGKVVQLLLERVLWQTTAWIDGKELGKQQSLSTAQIFEVCGGLQPGRHTLVLRIDNRKQHDISVKDFAHAYTDGTQIIWNGVIGQMLLQAKEKVHIASVQVFPGLRSKTVRTVVSLLNHSGKDAVASCKVQVFFKNGVVASGQQSVSLKGAGGETTLTLPVGQVHLWDEFHPDLYTVKVTIEGDERQTQFGMREWSNNNSALQLNGRPAFLRGTLECNIFPLTGHPPMDKAGWTKVFSAAKAWGLNHLRFHSWCPPEAAFAVADSMGFYLQVELPLWVLTVGQDAPTLDFISEEAHRIITAYGNHPSFSFWSMGNELEGDFSWLQNLVRQLKQKDNRHLYTTTTFTFQKGHGRWPEPTDDFFITQYTPNGWVRGQGIFNDVPPDFVTDYTKAVGGLPVPLIIHEVGQYSVYPNMNEITKYTGVLDPLNFKAIKKDLQRKNLLHLSPAFTQASGKLAVNLYKEEIERALKTQGASGFQLLDLHDFPGQGTALVGLLDAFWESKGLIEAADFRRFCGPVVPLIRFAKAAYTQDEVFKATAELANYSGQALQKVQPAWRIKNNKGTILAKGTLPLTNVAEGSGQQLGAFEWNLKSIREATELTIEVELLGTPYQNQWRIWVYPSALPAVASQAVFTTDVQEALQLLDQGKNVVLNPDTARIKGVPGRFAPVFWSPVHFPDQPGTMGLMPASEHPALKHFPTRGYSDWQWWDVVTRSKTMIIDSLNNDLDPVVRVVDNFFKNRKMATVLEAKVGKGNLLICSMDIHSDLEKRPVARQLRYSLLQYAAGRQFKPSMALSDMEVRNLFKDIPTSKP